MKSPLSRVALAAAVLAALAAVAIVFRQATATVGRAGTSAPRAPAVARAHAPSAVELARRQPARPAELGFNGDADGAPASLRGTEVDGWIGADDAGHLVVTPGARWFFDYFLSATGEQSAEEIRAHIVGEIERRLPTEAAREAIDLLDRHLAYRQRARVLYDSSPSENVAERLRELHRIRVEIFGDADASALFGEEEAVQALDVQRREVLSDQTLTPEERERRLDDIDAKLPPPVRQARGAATAPLRLMRDEQLLRDAGGTVEDVRTLREQRFGSEAADRLAALDAERAEWDNRLADYRRARQQIADDPSLDGDRRARAFESLLDERFTAAEKLRVQALDGSSASAP